MKKILSFFAAILFAGSMMATDVAVTIHASSGDYYAKTNGWQNGTQYDQVVLDDVISANLVGSGNNGKYYSDWRFYTEGSDAGSFSIDAIEGYALKSVTFTYTPSNSGALYMGETKLTSKAAVELSGRKAVFQCKNTNTSTNGQVRLTAIAVTYEKSSGEEPPVETKYYMKNNWDAGSEWTWKEMSKSATGAGLYVLENVVYGGTGVNFNTKTEDDGSSWVAQEAMEGDNAQIAAKDTVSFTLNPAKGAVIAKLVGKFQSGEEPPVMTPKFYITGNAALVGDELAWHPDAIPSYAEEYVFEKLTAAEYQLKITENGKWESAKGYDDLAAVPEGVSADKDRNIVFKLAKEQSDLKVSYAGGKIKIEGEFYVEEPPVVLDKYYMKNNWDGGEWTWLEMTPSDAAVNQYMLKDAIFGGTGVNYNKVADDKDATWVPLDEIIVDVDMKLEAKDTADFVLDVVAKTVSALNIRKFQSGAEPPIGTPLYYITGESLVGSWAPDALPVYKSLYEFESVKAGSYSFKITVDGTWATAKGYDDLTLKQDGLSKDKDGNICFTLAEDGPVAVVYNEREFMVRGNFVVSEPPVVAGNIWKVVEETSVEAGATHLENDYLKISNAYASTLKPNVRTIAGEEFTHAIQVRVDAWPTSAEPRGKEKTGSTSIILTAKENIAITLYYNRQVVDGGGSDNDNKDVWVYDQASLDKPLTGEFVIDQILEGNSYLNATKKLSLEKGHTYTICAKGTTLQLHGIKFEAAEGPVEVKYYLKNNWDAGSEWTWKEMSKSVTAVGLFVLEDAIYGGTGVNFNTEEKDETATWVPEDQFVIAQELKLEPKDTANFLLNPKPAEGEAYISVVNIRKFQGGEPPVETPKFYITGNAALVGDELAWHPDAIPSYAEEYVFEKLTAAEYQLKITENGKWESAKGYDDLAAVPEGVSADKDRNIVFKLAKEQSDLKVSYADGKITLVGEFDVPEPPVSDKYYLKNNWGAGSEWTWKEMSKSVTAAGLFVLEDAIYGGTGVNFNTEEKDETATWVPEDQFVIAQELKLEPKDTANFLLNPKPAEGEAYISVVNIRKFQDVPVVGCNWDDIEWFNVGLGEGDENFNQFKICKQGELPNVVNIQTAPWADNNKGIYINFPSAEFTTISLPEGQYKVDGAGILLFLSAFSAIETEVSILYKGEPVVFTVYNGKVDIPEVKYYMKNNWDAGSEWTWKEMTKMEGADGIYRLEQVIFGGTGVNYNTKADDEGAAWVELKDIVVPEGMELAAKDTADFQLEIAGPAPVVRALGIRKFQGGEPPVEEHTYSLVGPLSPAGWNEKSDAGDMTLVDGVYVFKLENVELVAGTRYEYKIVQDHSWAVAFPQSGNAVFTVEKSGKYNVTFTLNAETKEYAAIPELIEEVVVVPSVAMHGNFLGSWADTENFEVAGDKQSASLKLTIAKGNYEFGMRIGGKNNWMSNGVEFTRENPSAVVEAGSGNLKLAADVEGEYTFTWIFERSTLVITFPAAGPVEDPTVAVIGSMTEWQEAIPFTLSEDKKSAKLVVDKIPVGDYEFKMLINGQYRSNGYEFHRDFHACAGISGNVEANMVLKVDAKGEFTFEWFFENDSLNIIFPEKSEIPDLYIKNNWGGAEEWSWKQMTYEVVEGNGVYYIMDVVFGGKGVNLNSEPSDEDALWFPVENIQAFTPAQTKTELQALDTVMFAYYPAFETLIAVVTGPYNAPACEFEDGLYLVGSMNNWQKSKEYMLQINQSADGEEFMVELTLHTGDEFKVLWWAGCQEIAWIPGGTQNIIVDAAHAGLVRIYVRPAGNEAWPDKYWYYEVVIPENINNAEVNTKVVKMIENGQLFIQKGGKTYNVIGTLVK